MKKQYTIIGLQEEGNDIRLTISPVEPVKEKQSMTSILTDPLQYVENMKRDAIRSGRPESLSIPRELWEDYKWNISDIIQVEVLPL